jgi:hypothetical protein
LLDGAHNLLGRAKIAHVISAAPEANQSPKVSKTVNLIVERIWADVEAVSRLPVK